jgi:heme A synthase
MVDDAQVAVWRKYRRQSIQALPVAVGFLAAICIILFVVNLFVSVPAWLAVVLVAVAAFSVLGDAINIIYLAHRLRRAGKKEGSIHGLQ